MFRPLGWVMLSLGMLSLALSASAQEKLKKVEIGKCGKAATAFLEVARNRTGTAFCVHPKGLFITTEHIVRGVQKQEVTLVLNPSLESQQVLKARVIRSDPALDLALLRVEGAKDLPSLPRGSMKDVAELSDVVACGFPWNTNQSPASSTTYVLQGGAIKRYDNGELMHVIPGWDGRTVFTEKGIVSETLQRGDADDATYGYCLPAVRGDYFLSLSSAGPRNGGGFTVYLRGLKRPIARLDMASHGLAFNGWDRESWGPWKRVCFVPDAKVIVVLPASNDQVVLHKFDAEAALEKSGEDYLLVMSRPTSEAKAGAKFTYPIQVKSKQGGVTFKLDSGPKGMMVSVEGVVTWDVPADAPVGDQEVILTVRDKTGQEVFHTFALQVAK